MPNGKVVSGSGKTFSAAWDGKDGNGIPMGQGVYTAVVIATAAGGNCTAKSAEVVVKSACDLRIGSFGGTATTLDPTSGGSVVVSGTVAGGADKPVAWTMKLPNGKTISGSGSNPSATWDGKDEKGKVIEPGNYSADLTAQTADGTCSVSDTAPVTVTSSADCSLLVDWASTANVASGAMSHSQELFSSKGTGLATDMVLYYNSQDSHSGPLGTGWSHSYHIFLKENRDGSVVLHEGNGRRQLYTVVAGAYVGQRGNYGSLAKNPDGTFTITQKEGSRYHFGPNGAIHSISDRNGNALRFTYTGGNLTVITDTAGRSTELTYDSANHIASITDPDGNSYRLGYGGNTVTSVAYPDGGSWFYSYDSNAFMLSKTDPLGNSTSYAYDADRRVVSATDPEGRKRSLAYPQSGNQSIRTTRFTEKDGGVWTYSYDTLTGTLASKTDPEGGVTSYTYDASGNRTSTNAPDGTKSSYSYDDRGNMTSATDALGQTTSYTYNGFGQVLSVKAPQGNSTGYSYDARGNLAAITDPDGGASYYQYDGRGNVTKITNSLGQMTTFTYDDNGSLASVIDAGGATTSYTYDAAGNISSQTDAAGNTTRFLYNSRNHLIKMTGPQGEVTSYGYDLSGNRISQTDANGNTTSYEYNYNGEPVKQTDALGNSTTFAYGSAGCASCGGGADKLTSLTDANGNSTKYRYDALGRVVSETDPLGNSTRYSYDASGRIAAKTDANGATTAYTYDNLGRLLKKSYPDGSAATFTYDARGNILTAANENISYAFTYDAGGRPLTVTDSSGRTIQYGYDAAGRKTRTISPDGRTINYGYDAAGRLSTISDGGTFRFGYDNLGRRASLTYPNGDRTTYSYDETGNLVSLVHKNGKGAVIGGNSYTLDKIGNRLSNVTSERTISYQYDSIYRLTEALSSTPGQSSNEAGKGRGIWNAPQQQKELYAYDPVGNRLWSDRTKSYLHNQANQLLQNGGSYSYDNNGNLIRKVTSERPTTYEWDYEDRLVKVTPSDGTVGEFEYDPFGKRIQKKVSEAGVTTTIRYFYDEEDILFEYHDTGATGNRYTHGPGIDEPLRIATGNGSYYYHADGLGSIAALTDSGGRVVQSYEYDSFGNLKDQKSRIKQPYTYTAREWEKEVGLYYYRARYYDPVAGRFISKDPAGFRDGINLYVYAKGNPNNFADPSGLTALQYFVSEGVLLVDPERAGASPYSMMATSGRGNNMNRTDCECNKNKGPIPRGSYIAYTSNLSNPGAPGDVLRNMRGDWGDWRVPLTPDSGTNTLKRSGFFLHGGAIPGSAGCIDYGGGIWGNAASDRLLNDMLSDSDGKVPLVVR